MRITVDDEGSICLCKTSIPFYLVDGYGNKLKVFRRGGELAFEIDDREFVLDRFIKDFKEIEK